jgi:hypothetical protein
MTRDEIMALVNETAPRYESWGCEAHFQNFARRVIEIEREACAKICDESAGFRGCFCCSLDIRARGKRDV